MWKVVLEQDYIKLEFGFNNMEDAYCFIETAIRSNTNIKAIVTLEDKKVKNNEV